MANKVSREVDLTHNLVFQKDSTIHTRSTNISTPKRDPYKRYNEYERLDYTHTSSWTEPTSLNWTFDSTTSTVHVQSNQSYPISLFSSFNVDKIEERVCWRPLKQNYQHIHIVTSDEELSQLTSQFPMGSAKERSRILHPVIDHSYYNTCDCCGAPIKHNNCLNLYSDLCPRCALTFTKPSIPKKCDAFR